MRSEPHGVVRLVVTSLKAHSTPHKITKRDQSLFLSSQNEY